jgi:hypothetical protein
MSRYSKRGCKGIQFKSICRKRRRSTILVNNLMIVSNDNYKKFFTEISYNTLFIIFFVYFKNKFVLFNKINFILFYLFFQLEIIVTDK